MYLNYSSRVKTNTGVCRGAGATGFKNTFLCLRPGLNCNLQPQCAFVRALVCCLVDSRSILQKPRHTQWHNNKPPDGWTQSGQPPGRLLKHRQSLSQAENSRGNRHPTGVGRISKIFHFICCRHPWFLDKKIFPFLKIP